MTRIFYDFFLSIDAKLLRDIRRIVVALFSADVKSLRDRGLCPMIILQVPASSLVFLVHFTLCSW